MPVRDVKETPPLAFLSFSLVLDQGNMLKLLLAAALLSSSGHGAHLFDYDCIDEMVFPWTTVIPGTIQISDQVRITVPLKTLGEVKVALAMLDRFGSRTRNHLFHWNEASKSALADKAYQIMVVNRATFKHLRGLPDFQRSARDALVLPFPQPTHRKPAILILLIYEDLFLNKSKSLRHTFDAITRLIGALSRENFGRVATLMNLSGNDMLKVPTRTEWISDQISGRRETVALFNNLIVSPEFGDLPAKAQEFLRQAKVRQETALGK
jgi:hypothetical protein